MASHCMIQLLYLSFSLLVLSSCPAHGRKGGDWHTVRPSSLLPDTTCSSSSYSQAPDATNLPLFHRYGPCSPLRHRNHPSHVQVLDNDRSRAAAILRRASSTQNTPTTTSLTATIPSHLGSSLGTANYIVTVGLGTPKTDYTLIFDTGSDVTWTQCKPCTACYTQQDPLFDPSQSATYTNFPCSSAKCNLLDAPSCSSSGSCRYTVKYGDNSHTQGSLSQETLTLTPSDIIPNFTFGCGDSNSGLFGRTAGIIGLGRGDLSLASQTKQAYNGVFSYCIPSTRSASGYLNLGGNAPPNTQFTPMLSGYAGADTYYYLNLVSISVGGQLLPVSPTAFSNPGTIVDSGTVISRLPPAAYAALRAEFKRRMARYPAAPALSILDTCYNFSGYESVTIPVVALQFGGGVNLRLDFFGTVYVASVSQVCLAFTANDDAGETVIVGNTQQKKYSVVYDLSNRRIGFSPGGCS